MPVHDTIQRGAARYVWCVAGAACAVLSALVWGYTVDDAFIVFRYARNLVEGHGAVFNVGERVEGYSSPLWLSLATAAEALHLPGEQACKVSSLLIVVVFIRSVSRRLEGLHPASQAPLVLLGVYAPLHAAIVSGLETAANAAIIGWLLLSSYDATGGRVGRGVTASGGERVPLPYGRGSDRSGGVWEVASQGGFDWRRLAVWGGLALACRPENGLLVGIHGLYLWCSSPGRRRGLYAAAGVWLAVLGVETGARFAYYGALVPNTAVAKMGLEALRGGGGWFYCRTWLAQSWWFVLLGLPALLDRRTRGLAVNAWLLAAGQIAFVFLSGGDWMPQWRFMLPPAVLLAVVGCFSVDVAARAAARVLPAGSLPRACAAAAAAACAALAVTQLWHFRSVRWTLDYYARQLDALAAGPVEYLGRQAAEGDLVVARDIGVLGYRTRCRVLDMVGLTDSHVAKSSGYRHRDQIDLDYVYGRRPEYLMLQTGNERAAEMPLDNLATALMRDRRFAGYDLCDRWDLPGRHYCEVYRRGAQGDEAVTTGRKPTAGG